MLSFFSKTLGIVGAVILLTGCTGEPIAVQKVSTPMVMISPTASTASSSLSKQDQVKHFVMMMAPNSFQSIQTLLPDLKVQKIVDIDAVENLRNSGTETWYYSLELNQTIVVCDTEKAPIHIFAGSSPSSTDIRLAKANMKGINSSIITTSSTMPSAVGVVSPVATTESSVTTNLSAPVYEQYTSELYAGLKGNRSFVLFFHAPWCPTCKKMDQEFHANLSSFPQGTIILKTDYDTEIALRKTFGVQLQSTVVVFNDKGENVFKGTDPSISKIKEIIKQSL